MFASFMIGLHYLPTIHESQAACFTYVASPQLLVSEAWYSPAFHNSLMRITNTKHSWQNDTRCRDGVKVLWCHSDLVWLVPSLQAPVFILFCDFKTLLVKPVKAGNGQ